MPYIYIQSYTGPPSTLTICNPPGTICYTHPQQISEIDVFPYVVPLPSTFDSVGVISLTAQSNNGCVIIDQDICSQLPTPTATYQVPCYFFFVGTTDTWTAGDTLTYTDCDGNTDTYTTQAGDSAGFWLCAQSLDDGGTSLVWPEDVPEIQCENIGGQWIGPNPPSMTPTPTNPPTPTVTPSSGAAFYETFQMQVTGNNLQITYTVNPSSNPVYIDWGDTTISAITSTSAQQSIAKIYTGAYSAGTKTVTISGITNTAGKITSFNQFIVSVGYWYTTSIAFETLYRPYDQCFRQLSSMSSYSATTAQLSKFVNATQISAARTGFITGNISEFSACTNLTTLTLPGGTYSGDVANLPNSIRYLTFTNTSEYPLNESYFPEIIFTGFGLTDLNTVSGNISDLPSSLISVNIKGNNTLTGNVTGFANQAFNNNLITGTRTINIGGNNTLSGNFSDIPDIPYVIITNGRFNRSIYNMSYITTGCTITGNLSLGNNQTIVVIGGANTISGNLSATNNIFYGLGRMDTLIIAGNNTISGNTSNLKLPSDRFLLAGNNTLSGDITGIDIGTTCKEITIMQKGNTVLSPTAMTITNSGNTITGNISSLASLNPLKQIMLGGNNTVYGDIASLIPMPNLNVCVINSDNNGIQYNSTTSVAPIVASSFSWLVLKTNGTGLSATQMNNMLTTGALSSVNLDGTKPFQTVNGSGNAAPTSSAALLVKTNYNPSYPSNGGLIVTN